VFSKSLPVLALLRICRHMRRRSEGDLFTRGGVSLDAALKKNTTHLHYFLLYIPE
jgi:hypothetical protein